MRKYLTLATLALALSLPTAAQANGFFTNKVAGMGSKPGDANGFRRGLIPRAAPWYLYWPYPDYFTYPAPTGVTFPPGHMSPGNFHPNMYHGPGQSFVPYPTNGYGQ
jgi:hypothetical protein